MIESKSPKKRNISSQMLLRVGITIFVFLSLAVIFLPLMVTHWSWANLGVFKSNEIGDTIGGIMGPAVGLIGATLTFLAFWTQYDANLSQRRQIDIQDRRARLDAFESKFYTMLSIHRDNVDSMDINDVEGGKVFLHLMDELRFIYWTIRFFYREIFLKATPKSLLTDEEIYQVAYLSFFFGVGEKSTPLVIDLGGIHLEGFIKDVHSYIKEMREDNDKKKLQAYTVKTDNNLTLEWKRVHTLAVGHLRRLSHYIRHLFQTVKFVDDQSDELLPPYAKYDYITNLRAQLSTYEQLLLYYNALSVLGEPWLTIEKNKTESYLVKYCMIKSIPINSANFYLKPESILPDANALGKPMFEWMEIRKRVADITNKTRNKEIKN